MIDYTGTQMGNYRLLHLIGTGGFADVYLGQHVYLGTWAAIKVLRIQLATANLGEDFVNEAKTNFNLRHPNIVHVLEFSRLPDDTPYIVMDYAPNGTLRQHFPRGVAQSPMVILPYVKQVAAALQYAHERYVIHRDVKPENIFLGANNEALLGDFGIALILDKTFASQYLDIKDAVGTITYMAPEQIEGKPRRASDQYSLGVVVYEWLCGECPFQGTVEEVARQHKSAAPEPLHQKVPGLSPEIDKVVQKALAKKPEKRYKSTQDFAEALEKACQPVPNPPPPPGCSRRAVLAVLIGGLAVVGIGAITCALTSHSSPGIGKPPAVPVGTTLYTYSGHSNRVLTVAWSSDAKRIASGSLDKTVQVWGATNGSNVITYHGHKAGIESLAWLPGGTSIVSASDDQTEQIWDVSTRRTIRTYHGHTASVYAVACSLDGKRIASGGRDKTVHIWETATGKHLLTYSGHAGGVGSVVWSPDGKRIASASYDGTVHVWDAATGKRLLTYRKHTKAVFAVTWSPNGKSIASGSKDHTVQIWDAVTGNQIASYNDHTDEVQVVAWSPDSTFIASGSSDKTVMVWNVTSGNKVITYEKHTGIVFGVAWSPDGTRIASGSQDKTVQVWQAT